MHNLRVAICQPCVAHYRVPVFNLLGNEYDLTVFAGSGTAGLEFAGGNEHFKYIPSEVETQKLLGKTFLWQQSNIDVIDRRRFDIAVLSWDAHYKSLFSAVNKARKLSFPVVLWGHGYSKHPTFFGDWLRNWIGKRGSSVLLYNHGTADSLIENHGFDASKVFVAQNAIALGEVEEHYSNWFGVQNISKRESFQKRHSLDPAQTMIFMSRMDPANRLELAIKALALLKEKFNQIKLVVIGPGDTDNLRQLAIQLNVADRVIWTGGIFDQGSIAAWMSCSSLFVYPSNIGLSILHAMAYGLPVVTGDRIAEQNPEIEALVEGDNGLLYRADDESDLAKRVSTILSDFQLQKRMSANAYHTAHHVFTLKNMVKGFSSCLRATTERIKALEKG